jgi:hypothetical protein
MPTKQHGALPMTPMPSAGGGAAPMSLQSQGRPQDPRNRTPSVPASAVRGAQGSGFRLTPGAPAGGNSFVRPQHQLQGTQGSPQFVNMNAYGRMPMSAQPPPPQQHKQGRSQPRRPPAPYGAYRS